MSVNPVTVESAVGESVTPTVDDLAAASRISDDPHGSSLRGADMTLIHAANLHTADSTSELDTFDALSLAGVPEPTFDELRELEVFDALSLAAVPEPTFDELNELDVFDETPVGSSYARCSDGNGTLSHLFFSDDDFDIARAKAICSKCGLAEACLGGALERGEAAGVWGGQLIEDGEIVVLKRRRGRPPKVARPVLVVDEVPLPPHLVA
jgi:WhiB family redox-sensing transcriptional regulator